MLIAQSIRPQWMSLFLMKKTNKCKKNTKIILYFLKYNPLPKASCCMCVHERDEFTCKCVHCEACARSDGPLCIHFFAILFNSQVLQ